MKKEIIIVDKKELRKKPDKEQTLLCHSNLANCFCEEEKGHKGLHKCRCGGSWDNDFVPHSFPDIGLGFGAFSSTEIEEEILQKKKR